VISLALVKWLALLDPGFQLEGTTENIHINQVAIDSRDIEPGAAFFALPGERSDGHYFVKEAFDKGAAVCVVQKNWLFSDLLQQNGLLVRTENPLHTLQTLARNYRQQFTLTILGLTGSNGKTTTKEMAAAVLAKRLRIIKTPGNLNNHIGVPLSLLQIQNDTEIGLIEMGTNHPGEIKKLCGIAAPTHGLITNIGAGHLEFFGNLENVARAKAELFDSLPEEGVAFVNINDKRIKKIAGRIKNQIKFGVNRKADITGKMLGMNKRGCVRFRLQDEIDIQLKVPGRHQINNAVAAAALGVYWGIPITEIAAALANYSSFSKRMEWNDFHHAVVLLDAYNSNPDSLRAALDTLVFISSQRHGRAIAVLGDMLELGEQSQSAHEQAGHWAAQQQVSALLLYGNFSQFTAAGFRAGGGSNVEIFIDKQKLAATLSRQLQPQDVVLIKGSRGMAMETVWQELQRLAGN